MDGALKYCLRSIVVFPVRTTIPFRFCAFRCHALVFCCSLPMACSRIMAFSWFCPFVSPVADVKPHGDVYQPEKSNASACVSSPTVQDCAAVRALGQSGGYAVQLDAPPYRRCTPWVLPRISQYIVDQDRELSDDLSAAKLGPPPMCVHT